MKRNSSPMKSLTSENTDEEAVAQWLHANNAPDDIKERYTRVLKNKEEVAKEITDLRARVLYLEEAFESNKSYLVLYDLDAMILERVRIQDLGNVSRVRRTWRAYITTKPEKMRFLLVESITIAMASAYPIKIKYLNSERTTDKTDKISKLLCYRPLGFLILSPSIEHGAQRWLFERHMRKLNSVPDWWFNGMKKVQFNLAQKFTDAAPSLITRFTHLTELYFNSFLHTNYGDGDVNYVVNLIEKSPRADFFKFTTISPSDVVPNDLILEAIWIKSWDHAAEFPTIVGSSRFSVFGIIRFLEQNKFTNKEEHKIYIFAKVSGDMQNWEEWLERNTSMRHFSNSSSEQFRKPIDGVNYFLPNRPIMPIVRYWFTFRNQRFDLIMQKFS